MTDVTFDDIEVGDEIPELKLPPITRHTLALYCGASGDHNPIHVDTDFARAAGMDDVFAHGMLSYAYMGRMLAGWVPQSAIREIDGRFAAIVNVHDALTCSGAVAEKYEENGEKRVRLGLTVADEAGEIKVAGSAVVALP